MSMRHEDQAEVRSLPLFDGVAEAHIEQMLRGSFLQRFPAHVELIRETERADFLHVVVGGQVEVFAAYRERETTVSVLGPGASFIVAAVVLDRVYLKSARALSSSRILMIPADTVRHYFEVDAAFARALAVELASAYRGVVKELKNQKLRTSLERLANWLIVCDVEHGSSGEFTLPFDKKVLAARLGMAPEALSRSFAALAKYDVAVHGARIALNDVGALKKLAQPSLTIDDPEC
jgi:CRP/FNR family transcriptional regulator, transcriptional activator FtrB